MDRLTSSKSSDNVIKAENPFDRQFRRAISDSPPPNATYQHDFNISLSEPDVCSISKTLLPNNNDDNNANKQTITTSKSAEELCRADTILHKPTSNLSLLQSEGIDDFLSQNPCFKKQIESKATLVTPQTTMTTVQTNDESTNESATTPCHHMQMSHSLMRLLSEIWSTQQTISLTTVPSSIDNNINYQPPLKRAAALLSTAHNVTLNECHSTADEINSREFLKNKLISRCGTKKELVETSTISSHYDCHVSSNDQQGNCSETNDQSNEAGSGLSFKERNRIAAQKARRKRKQYVKDVEKEREKLSSDLQAAKVELTLLREENQELRQLVCQIVQQVGGHNLIASSTTNLTADYSTDVDNSYFITNSSQPTNTNMQPMLLLPAAAVVQNDNSHDCAHEQHPVNSSASHVVLISATPHQPTTSDSSLSGYRRII